MGPELKKYKYHVFTYSNGELYDKALDKLAFKLGGITEGSGYNFESKKRDLGYLFSDENSATLFKNTQLRGVIFSNVEIWD